MDLITLTDDEARDLLARVYAEVQRRETIANAPAQVERISRAWADASGRQDGDPWTQPVGAHDVWATDAVCQWPVGTYWQATSATAHEPGTTGAPWVRVWPDGPRWTTTPPSAAGPIPWAIGQQIKAGDKRTHGGRVWTAKLAHTTHAGWPPSAATHAVWTDNGPA